MTKKEKRRILSRLLGARKSLVGAWFALPESPEPGGKGLAVALAGAIGALGRAVEEARKYRDHKEAKP